VEEDLLAFDKAIHASDTRDPRLEFIVTSMNEWQTSDNPRPKTRKASERTKDEGREGYSYRLLRWPAFVCFWDFRLTNLLVLGIRVVALACVCSPVRQITKLI